MFSLKSASPVTRSLIVNVLAVVTIRTIATVVLNRALAKIEAAENQNEATAR